MSRVVSRSCLMPVFSEKAIQISGTSTPSRSSVTIDCFTGLFSKDWAVMSSRSQMKRVTIQVPASTSNLGSGFDTLGLAVSRSTRLKVESAEGERVELISEGPPEFSELIQAAAGAFFAFAQVPSFGLRIAVSGNVPIARGL